MRALATVVRGSTGSAGPPVMADFYYQAPPPPQPSPLGLTLESSATSDQNLRHRESTPDPSRLGGAPHPPREGSLTFEGTAAFSSVCVAEEMNPTRRNTMEDVYRVVPVFDGDKDTSFVAVYDGHGGRGIVDFIATELERNIASELRVQDGASISDKICRAYLLTDVQSRQAQLMVSGATAVTCLIKRCPDGSRTLHAANVGDSRAVLCFQGRGIRLTRDHKADDHDEVARIEAAGGFVLRNRVLGILAVSRSFGDHRMKNFVIGVPFTSTFRVNDVSEAPFLILACDGVWDVMTDDEAVQLILALTTNRDSSFRGAAADLLVQHALARGSADNITCIVVFL